MSKQRAILKAASALPPRQARRVVAAIAAKTQDDKTQDAREDASEDPYLEAAADAMQAALEAAVVDFLKTQDFKTQDSRLATPDAFTTPRNPRRPTPEP